MELAHAIREAVDAELGELAANLASTDDAHFFGDNESKIRVLSHRRRKLGRSWRRKLGRS